MLIPARRLSLLQQYCNKCAIKALFLQHEYHNRSNDNRHVRPALRGLRLEVWRQIQKEKMSEIVLGFIIAAVFFTGGFYTGRNWPKK